MATSWNRVSVLDGKLRKAHYSLLNLLQPTKIILQTQYFFLDYIHNLKLKGINVMLEHQKNIINEYISTAMISDDPEYHIKWALMYLITSLNPDSISGVIEVMYQQEKKIEIRK